MELVCPAGNFPALKEAVNNGADAVYLGLKDDTNARHFAGLNFNEKNLPKAIDYAHQRGTKVFVAINTYPQPNGWKRWQKAVDTGADRGVDALIIADIGILDYAANKHPQISRHLSVQGSATSYESLRYYQQNFGIKRAVLPRVLSVSQVAQLALQSPVELEVFGFGSLCIMAEGRCHLSSYVTGESPNTCGACSPAKSVRWEKTPQGLESRLNDVLIDRYDDNENAGYPTLCKGRFTIGKNTFHVLEEPTSLNTIEILPELDKIGIKAIKIEGRQRSPAYTQQVTQVWRQAIDCYYNDPENYTPLPQWSAALNKVSEGSQTTLGAYSRPWQ
ncbi:MAG: U32 family peptidase [Gammaproteobacteria bacterium]|nr:MAG: U32 family peptidase [Gammaproteobacteria bacterium]